MAVGAVLVIAAVIVVLFVKPGFLLDKQDPGTTPPMQTQQTTPSQSADPSPSPSPSPTEPTQTAAADDRQDVFDGDLYRSTGLPVSFMLHSGWTATESQGFIEIVNASGNGNVTIAWLVGTSPQIIIADKTALVESAVVSAGGTTYEINVEEETTYYGIPWYEIKAETNSSDGAYVYILLGIGDDGKGGTILYYFALNFGAENTLPIEDLTGGLDIFHSMMINP
jgi:hypothetical protein